MTGGGKLWKVSLLIGVQELAAIEEETGLL
jgi:hypothetical protein